MTADHEEGVIEKDNIMNTSRTSRSSSISSETESDSESFIECEDDHKNNYCNLKNFDGYGKQ